MIKPNSLNDSVFFAWTRVSRRSEQMAKYFGLSYIRYNRFGQSPIPLLGSLILNFIKTCLWVVINRPKYVFTFQAHPFITISAILGTWIARKGIVIPDLHTASYTDHFSGIQGALSKWIWTLCPVILIHNPESKEYLSKIIPEIKNNLFVLEDALPAFPKSNNQFDDSKLKCALISRFADDEPIEKFLNAVLTIDDCHFYVTGNSKKANFDISKFSSNITFTDFLSDENYLNLLQSTDFLVILTTRELTLLSGGYESLALKKPMIVSDTRTLREYFGDGAIYTLNNEKSISNSIRAIIPKLDFQKTVISNLLEDKKKGLELQSKKATSNSIPIHRNKLRSTEDNFD